MKKFILLIVLLVATCFSAHAQVSTKQIVFRTTPPSTCSSARLYVDYVGNKAYTGLAGVCSEMTGGGGSGDVSAVGDCASGACFNGTQGTVLTFNNAGGDATQTYDGTSFIFTHPLDLGAAGVRLSGDGDGAVTLLGLGNGSDENLTLNLDDTSDVGTFSSSTGLASLIFSGIGLTADSYTTSSTAAGAVTFNEPSGTGTDGVTLSAPASVTTAYTMKFPAAPTAGHLKFDGTDAITFSLPTFKTWFPAAGCNNATASSFYDLGTSLAPTPTCKNSSSGAAQNAALDFPDSDGMFFGQATMMLPSDFTGTIDAKIRWLAAATSGDVIWNVSTICVADAEVDNPAFNAVSPVTDTAKGTTLQSNDATITSVTITGCAAGELMHFKISRDRTTSGDTITGVVSFLGLELTTSRAQ